MFYLIRIQECVNALISRKGTFFGIVDILEAVFQALGASCCMIYFPNEKKTGTANLIAVFPETLQDGIPRNIDVNQGLLQLLMKDGKPVLLSNPKLELPIAFKFVIPLIIGTKVFGFLAGNKNNAIRSMLPSEDELSKIGVYLGNMISLILEKAFFKEKDRKMIAENDAIRKKNQALENSLKFLDRENDALYFEKQYIETELNVAKEIQEKFFPREALITPYLSAFGTSLTASAVGGDFFDYFLTPQGWMVVLIGDVAGHGVPAAMVVAMVRGLILHLSSSFNPATAQSAINNLLLKIFKRKMMTGAFAVFSPEFQKILISNAGHLYPYFIRDGKISSLSLPSNPMGVLKKAKFSIAEFSIKEGDVFVFFSDGLVEALATDGEQVGYNRFEEILSQIGQAEPTEYENIIRAWHYEITGGKPLADDVTLVITKVNSQ
ncbi:MAG: SpoIIE family protein phosphatase [Candidatus Riflebacteria bacterium]|nr:SpoIIE family protein phosphatase [Candidatus Riflebacteria bacterium]